MKTISLQINGLDYPIKFGFKANRFLGDMWKINTYGGVLQAVSKAFQFPKNAEPSMKQYKQIGDLVLSGVLSMTPDASVTSDDVVDALFDDLSKLEAIVDLYMKSMPKSFQEATPQKSKNVKRVKK